MRLTATINAWDNSNNARVSEIVSLDRSTFDFGFNHGDLVFDKEVVAETLDMVCAGRHRYCVAIQHRVRYSESG
jgi:hypothetical protein